MVRILFFGRLRDAAGGPERVMPLPDGVATAADLIAFIAARETALGAALADPTIRIVTDNEVAPRDAPLSGVAEIAFLPPASGG
ncbi:MAG: MoaD/ThiS family protein [Parvularculaceae bacterium]|nr:MoaD/ThiS family protein [Parvularculaceae bacterium]